MKPLKEILIKNQWRISRKHIESKLKGLLMAIKILSSDTDIKHFFFCEQHFGTVKGHPHLAILPAILLGEDAPLYGFEIL